MVRSAGRLSVAFGATRPVVTLREELSGRRNWSEVRSNTFELQPFAAGLGSFLSARAQDIRAQTSPFIAQVALVAREHRRVRAEDALHGEGHPPRRTESPLHVCASLGC